MIHAAEKIGKELLLLAVPELVKKMQQESPKQAVKITVRKTPKKQVGRGSRSRKSHPKRTTAVKRKTRGVIPRKRAAKRSRSDFFSKVKNDF